MLNVLKSKCRRNGSRQNGSRRNGTKNPADKVGVDEMGVNPLRIAPKWHAVVTSTAVFSLHSAFLFSFTSLVL